MVNQDITSDVMEYMVWVVELVADEFFDGDKSHTYKVLTEQGIWDLYIQSYESTHSLGASVIIAEISEILKNKEVI